MIFFELSNDIKNHNRSRQHMFTTYPYTASLTDAIDLLMPELPLRDRQRHVLSGIIYAMDQYPNLLPKHDTYFDTIVADIHNIIAAYLPIIPADEIVNKKCTYFGRLPMDICKIIMNMIPSLRKSHPDKPFLPDESNYWQLLRICGTRKSSAGHLGCKKTQYACDEKRRIVLQKTKLVENQWKVPNNDIVYAISCRKEGMKLLNSASLFYSPFGMITDSKTSIILNGADKWHYIYHFILPCGLKLVCFKHDKQQEYHVALISKTAAIQITSVDCQYFPVLDNANSKIVDKFINSALVDDYGKITTYNVPGDIYRLSSLTCMALPCRVV